MNKSKVRDGQNLKLCFLCLNGRPAGGICKSENRRSNGFQGKQIVVKGQVTDQSTGKGIQGSAVVIKGTTSGTLTDAKGEYSIEVNDPIATLVFSCVGYKRNLFPWMVMLPSTLNSRRMSLRWIFQRKTKQPYP